MECRPARPHNPATMRCSVSSFSAPGISILLFLCAAQCIAQLDPTNSPSTVRFSALARMKVESRDGHELGKVRNVVFDLNRGTVRFVLLAPDSILTSRSQLRAAPPQLLSAATAKRDVLAFHVTQNAWDQAPVLTSSDISTLGREDQTQRIHRYYAALEKGAETAASNTSGEERLAATGSTNNPGKAAATRTVLASDLVGSRVVDREREKLGEVLDVVLALQAEAPAFAVITLARDVVGEGTAFAVPLRNLKIESGGNVMINWDGEQSPSAPWFDETTISNTSVSGLFRYRLVK